jgi:hypothetical protein
MRELTIGVIKKLGVHQADQVRRQRIAHVTERVKSVVFSMLNNHHIGISLSLMFSRQSV